MSTPVHSSHTLYTEKDFTDEELNRDNLLAVAVVRDRAYICKICGHMEHELEHSCEHNQAVRKAMRLKYQGATKWI